MEGLVNWAHLPASALWIISRRLLDPQELIRFRAVCRNWSLVVPRHDHRRFLPWIVEKLGEDEDSGDVLFYSLAFDKYHLIHVYALEGKRVAGYGAGLLLGIDTEDELSAVLVNPLTGEATDLPRLPECFRETVIYGFATDPLMTGDEDMYVHVYNWPTLQTGSNVALWSRGDDAGWATIPSQNFWMDVPSHRHRLLIQGPEVLQLEQAVAPNEIDWVPGMEDVHSVEHLGQVRLLARQEHVDGLARAPRANFQLYDMIGDNGWAAVAWDDAPELRDVVVLQSEDCSCYVLPADDFPELCKNSIYFLSWEREDELAGGDGDGGNSYSYYLCKWDMVQHLSTVEKKIPGFWYMIKPGMWFMPTLDYF
jgi:hypothetical protein